MSDDELKLPNFIKDQADIERFNRIIMENEIYTPSKLWLDLELIKDLSMGALMTLILEKPNREELYNRFIAGVSTYRTRRHFNYHDYFKDIGISKIEIEDRLFDSSRAVDVFSAAPSTLFLDTLFSRDIVDNQKNSKMKGIVDDITVTINTYPLYGLNDTTKETIAKYFTEMFGVDVVVDVFRVDRMSVDDFLKYDLFYMYRWYRMTNENPAISQAFTDQKFADKKFIVPKLFGLDATHLQGKTDEEYEHEARLIKARYMSLCLDLEWIEPQFISPAVRADVTPKDVTNG